MWMNCLHQHGMFVFNSLTDYKPVKGLQRRRLTSQTESMYAAASPDFKLPKSWMIIKRHKASEDLLVLGVKTSTYFGLKKISR